MADKSKIIERIVKLFKLSGNNPSENEIMAATTKARQLMQDHNIAMADIEGITDKASADRVVYNIRTHTAYTRKIRDLAEYDRVVSAAIEHLFGVKALYYSGKHPLNLGYSHMKFVGEEIDAQIAAEVFHIILTHVRKMSRAMYGSATWGKSHTSYAIGFGMRLVKKAEDMAKEKQSQTLALVVYSKANAIKRWLDDNVVWDKSESNRKKEYDETAYVRGWVDGDQYKIDNFRTSMNGEVNTLAKEIMFLMSCYAWDRRPMDTTTGHYLGVHFTVTPQRWEWLHKQHEAIRVAEDGWEKHT